jgi:hypothetical protein
VLQRHRRRHCSRSIRRSRIVGPTAAFDLDSGVYEFAFSSTLLGSLVLEVQTAGIGQPFVGNRVLNVHRLEGVTSVTLGPGTYRLNNIDAAAATVTVSGP